MQLWVLWELLLAGEPLLVIAPTPAQCSEAVAALVSLAAPLPCTLDFRPYFTIHDPDFPALTALKDGEVAPAMLLGVTNIFFLKALRALPHVLSVGTSTSTAAAGVGANGGASNGGRPSSGRLRPNGQAPSSRTSPVRLQMNVSPLRRFHPSSILRAARGLRDGPLSLMVEHREALWTNHTPATKPDTAVLNRLVDTKQRPSRDGGAAPVAPAPAAATSSDDVASLVNNEILRRHFVELTTNFLAPFGERCISSPM
eukprot:SM004596S16125  [mRNA]  locus=s4596:103:1141:+ [translate_table: standard]